MPDGAFEPRAAPATLSGDAAHALLQIWLSPSFPVGAFAYSHGLEKAAELGAISDRGTLSAWLRDLIEHGSLRNDAILIACAWRAVCTAGIAALAEIAELALAFQPSAERYLESTQQGRSFLAAIRAAWPCPAIETVPLAPDGAIAYPVAFATAAAGHGIPLGPALRAFAVAVTGNLISAAIRLSVIGQTDGQRLIADLLPVIEHACGRARIATLDDLGGAAFRSDVASLAHETQYTRIFRS